MAAISGALVLALLGYLILRAIREAPPASIEVTIVETEPHRSGDGWAVPLDVHNAGGAPAKEVVVEAELVQADSGAGGTPGAPEPSRNSFVARATLDYLAEGERQRLYAVFEEDPRGSRVAARVVAWQEP